MKRPLLSLLGIALLAGAVSAAPLRPSRTPSYAPGQVLVLAHDGGALELQTGGRVAAHDARLRQALTRHRIASAERVGAVRRPGALRLLRLRGDGPDFDPIAAARDLRATGAVRAAWPDYRIPIALTLPNDSLRIYQWYVYEPDTRLDIHLPEAWDVEQGDSTTLIAILDTGVDIGHRDLKDNIWTNPGEIAGNSLDDDGNGLIDDVHGWDFGMNDNDPSPEYTPDPSGLDIGFHGTFCAGLAAATTDNVSGISGAGWNCEILPLKAAKTDTVLSTSAVVAGMLYAADMGAHVLSMSFGTPDSAGAREFFQPVVDEALAAGVICVAAAGNKGESFPTIPASCDSVIAVAATDTLNQRAEFSNWGHWVDVAAPGFLMWSTICSNYELDFISWFYYQWLFYYDGENPYMYGDGTSFACPLVAGVCGLMRSRNPALTSTLAEQVLIASGDVVAYDHPIGPKVNAAQAVTQSVLAVGKDPAPGGPRLRAAPNPSASGTTLRFALSRASETRLAIYDLAGRVVRELHRGVLAAGPHLVAWDGRDAAGTRAAAGVYFARLEGAGRVASTKVVRLER